MKKLEIMIYLKGIDFMGQKKDIKTRIKEYYNKNKFDLYVIGMSVIYTCILLIYRDFFFSMFIIILEKICKIIEVIFT